MSIFERFVWFPLVLLFFASWSWDTFASGDYVFGIVLALTVLVIGLGIVVIPGATATAAKRGRSMSRSIPQDVKIVVAARDQGCCQHCGTSAPPMQYDHVIPYSMGGDNSVENIQLLCRRCNAAKSNRYVG